MAQAVHNSGPMYVMSVLLVALNRITEVITVIKQVSYSDYLLLTLFSFPWFLEAEVIIVGKSIVVNRN